MRLFKISIFIALSAFLYSVYIRKDIADDFPDRLQIILMADFLSFSERVADLTEALGFFNRWWIYPGNLYNLPVRSKVKETIKVEWKEFSGIKSVVITPKAVIGETERSVIIYYHGGGWVLGSVESYMDVILNLAEDTGSIVMSPNYRLSPHYTFPTPYEDCLNSTLDFLSKSNHYNINKNKIVIMGDSAGGNLALGMTVALQDLHKKNLIDYQPEMQVLIYPYLQMVDFEQPSHIVNGKYFISLVMSQKCFLSYVGIPDEANLSDKMRYNLHLNNEDAEIKAVKEKYLNMNNIHKKYQLKKEERESCPYSPLDDATQRKMKKLVLDTRLSPLLLSDDIIKSLPRTHVLACHYDPLRDDSLLLVNRLNKLGVDTTLQYLDKSPHGVLNLVGLFEGGYHRNETIKMNLLIKDHLQFYRN